MLISPSGDRVMTNTCRLCKQTGQLRESHIFPKFVFRWLTRTGGEYFRGTANPNLRVQDGPKERLLCGDCEQRFSVREKWFAEKVFKPYIEQGEVRFDYDSALFYFAVSLLWRILENDLRALHPSLAHFRAQLVGAEEQWRMYLLGGQIPPVANEVHIFATDVGLVDNEQPVEGFNLYMARTLDGEVIGGRTRCAVYAKLPRFIFFGAITPTEQRAEDGTLVAHNGGVLRIPQRLSDGSLGEFLIDRVRVAREKMVKGMSDLQQARVEKHAQSSLPKMAGTDLFKVLSADATATIKPFISGKVGRNESCPCGSLKKFKKCHGSRG
ncbi:SEC-C domain-containing protein [Myxococcus sp. AM001]|nr:SEC-C domain-containing protein [Myxococcus sp. AM001]